MKNQELRDGLLRRILRLIRHQRGFGILGRINLSFNNCWVVKFWKDTGPTKFYHVLKPNKRKLKSSVTVISSLLRRKFFGIATRHNLIAYFFKEKLRIFSPLCCSDCINSFIIP